MVTAILPAMTYRVPSLPTRAPEQSISNSSHGLTPSISSELTITPTRYETRSQSPSAPSLPVVDSDAEPSTSQLSGLVGMFTGLGALLALGVFLPLPTRFQKGGVSPSDAVADSFYVVGTVALLVAVLCFFGLRNLPSEQYKGWRKLFNSETSKGDEVADAPEIPSYLQLLLRSLSLGTRDVNIGLGYVGGFVARASSVAIATFIPLFVHQYFISSGRCPANPDESMHDPHDIRRNCQRAYIVASILTGVSQTVALVCAPLFGYLNAHYAESNLPLLVSAAAGVAGYAAFGRLKSPDPTSEDGNFGTYFIVALLGISQIGAIVSSLDLISRGIQTEDTKDPFVEDGYVATIVNQNHATPPASHQQPANGTVVGEQHTPAADETSMPSHLRRIRSSQSRAPLKGSIAGMYSLCGGAGILILTKVGGLLFDTVDVGVPFFLMAAFNAILLVIGVVSMSWGHLRKSTSGDPEERRSLLGNGHID